MLNPAGKRIGERARAGCVRSQIAVDRLVDRRGLAEALLVQADGASAVGVAVAGDLDGNDVDGKSAANHGLASQRGRRPGEPDARADGVGLDMIRARIAGAGEREAAQRVELHTRDLRNGSELISRRRGGCDNVLGGWIKAIHVPVIPFLNRRFAFEPYAQVQERYY